VDNLLSLYFSHEPLTQLALAVNKIISWQNGKDNLSYPVTPDMIHVRSHSNDHFCGEKNHVIRRADKKTTNNHPSHRQCIEFTASLPRFLRLTSREFKENKYNHSMMSEINCYFKWHVINFPVQNLVKDTPSDQSSPRKMIHLDQRRKTNMHQRKSYKYQQLLLT